MSRGAELIKKIDEHIKEAGGLCGLELPDSDLRFIRKVLEVQEDLINTGELGEREYCPFCGKRIRGKYCIGGRTFTPPFCCLCGKPLKTEGGNPQVRNSEGYKDPTAGAAIAIVRRQERRRRKEEKREQKTGESSHAGESKGAEPKRPQAGAGNA